MRLDVAARVKMLPPYLFGKLNALKYEKRRKGLDIIDLGMGNPLDPTPKPIVDKLCHAVQDPRNHRYSTATGIFSLKREVGLLYERRYGVKIDPANEIICTIGSKEAFSHLCLALLGPGDMAIVPQPAFPIHTYAVRLAGATGRRRTPADPPAASPDERGEEQMVRDVDRLMRVAAAEAEAARPELPAQPDDRHGLAGLLRGHGAPRAPAAAVRRQRPRLRRDRVRRLSARRASSRRATARMWASN